MIKEITVQNFKRFEQPTTFQMKQEGVTYLAGGNNSGKSTFLQALAVWEFARNVIEIRKGRTALLAGASGQGVGVSAEEFSPVALPDLKHLWSNLRLRQGGGHGGYTMRIRCQWDTSDVPPQGRHLEFGFALSNERLFIKRTDSNLVQGDRIPRLAYLPPFAGIAAKEERMSFPARKRWIGRGLSGAVLRNTLLDFWEKNRQEKTNIKNPRGRIPRKLLADLRKTDSWERLAAVLQEVFKIGITLGEFSDHYHTNIEVKAWEGQLMKKYFRKLPDAASKDLMVEGSGFLQWLSVYALAVDESLDVLLLDEPDAHLHPSLQGHLVHKLNQLAVQNRKQVLLATHSTTILSEAKLEQIFRMENRKYLADERARVSLFVGLGSQYAPRLDQLKRCQRLFLHDGPSDLEFLQAWAKTLGHSWPDNLVCWSYTGERKAREILFSELKSEIPGLKGLSLQDRDDYPFTMTKQDLSFDDLAPFVGDLGLRRWRRRNIENYLLWPAAISRVAGVPEKEVQDFLGEYHALKVTNDFLSSNCPLALALTDGKKIFMRAPNDLCTRFNIDCRSVAAAMTAAEIPEDVKTLIQQLNDLSK